jgi:hypothetical protein
MNNAKYCYLLLWTSFIFLNLSMIRRMLCHVEKFLTNPFCSVLSIRKGVLYSLITESWEDKLFKNCNKEGLLISLIIFKLIEFYFQNALYIKKYFKRIKFINLF